MFEAKMMAYPIYIFIQSFVKIQILDPKIQMKRAKRLKHSYLHIHTYYPSHKGIKKK